jgi:outer membrane protein TolC
MSRPRYRTLIAFLMLAAPGCFLRERSPVFDADLVHYQHLASSADYADADATAATLPENLLEPRTIRDTDNPEEWWDLRLDEALQIAISRSPVLRDLGGAVLRTPAAARTSYNPSIDASDPRQGMEAALAAFDASFSTGLFFEKNNRMANTTTFANPGISDQRLVLFQSQLSKVGAAGTQMFLRANTTYDFNNSALNYYGSDIYDTILETELRQPLLQGAGVNFNRIAGPNAAPGTFGGVMVARLNTDVSLVDFRIALRDLVSNVENAYWDLYYAYRDLNAKIEARNRSLETWRAIYVMWRAGQQGGEAEREAQFREQYYRFEQEVKNALTGRLEDRTTTFNGSSGGTFKAVGGVHVAERRLRLLLGLDINDRRMLRPTDEPTLAPMSYQWSNLAAEGLTCREELQRQRLQVRRRELELLASRNFLLPRFDVVGRYRLRGMGKYLFTESQAVNPPVNFNYDFEQSSVDNLLSGDYQEWQVGGELSFPIGFRRAHAAVRNAQLQLARERAVLEEQERQILHDLSNSVADVARAYEIVQTNYNGRLAAKTQVVLLREKLKEAKVQINHDQMIDAERRFSDADSQYYRSLVEYMVALKNVQFEKGTLLEYCHVELAECQDACGGYLSAVKRSSVLQGPEQLLDYTLSKPPAETEASGTTESSGAVRPAPAESGPASAPGIPPSVPDPTPQPDTAAAEEPLTAPLPGPLTASRTRRLWDAGTAPAATLPPPPAGQPVPPPSPPRTLKLVDAPAPTAERLPVPAGVSAEPAGPLAPTAPVAAAPALPGLSRPLALPPPKKWHPADRLLPAAVPPAAPTVITAPEPPRGPSLAAPPAAPAPCKLHLRDTPLPLGERSPQSNAAAAGNLPSRSATPSAEPAVVPAPPATPRKLRLSDAGPESAATWPHPRPPLPTSGAISAQLDSSVSRVSATSELTPRESLPVQPATVRKWRLSDSAATTPVSVPTSPARKWQKLSAGDPYAE